MELQPEHLDDAVAEAKRWFAAKKGVEKEFTIQLASGIVEYDVPEDCDAVLDVVFSGGQFDVSLVFSPHIFADEKVPYNVFAAPSSGGLYSSFVQALQYNEMARRIIGAENNFEYFPHQRKLFLFPSRNSSGTVIVRYKSTENTIELLPERDHDLIKKYALAWARRDLGNIRSKYASMPTAQGQTVLNGRELLAEAKEEFALLEQEIADSAFPMPWVTG